MRTRLPGSTIAGRYVVHRVIGEGAMGAVYETENTWTGRRVAIKLLHPSLSRREDTVARFMQEARVTTRIAHPNIVEVLDMGRDAESGELYIVQELLVGEDLRDWLTRNHRARPSWALETLTPIVAALAAAHARGVVHRDIKPENIFLSKGPQGGPPVPKLIDFGVSKVTTDAPNAVKTAYGQVVGTPEYMSPEQLLGERPVDGRVDVWAAGVVLYELLSGVSPFGANLPSEVVARVLTETPARIETLVPDVPAAVSAVVHGALERDPDRRTPTASALVDALLQAHQSLGARQRLDPELRYTARRRSEPRPARTGEHDAQGATSKAARAALPAPTLPGAEPDEIDEIANSALVDDEDGATEVDFAQLEGGEGSASDDVFRHHTTADATPGFLLSERPLRAGGAATVVDLPLEAVPAPEPLHEDEVLAVEALLADGAFSEVLTQADQALERAGGESGELAGRLRAAQASAFHWLGESAQSAWCASEALSMLTTASGRWLNSLGEAALAFGARGDGDALVALTQELYAAWASVETVTPLLAVAAARLASQLMLAGWPELAAELLDTTEGRAGAAVLAHPLVRAWMLRAKALRARAEHQPGRAVSLTAQAIVAFESASDARTACAVRAELGDVRRALGDFSSAERVLRMAGETARALGLEIEHAIRSSLAETLTVMGDAWSAQKHAREVLEYARERGNGRLELQARIALARALLVLGEIGEASALLDAVVHAKGVAPTQRVVACALHSMVLGAQQRWDDALDSAERALDRLQTVGALEEGEFLVHLAYVRALRACRHERAAEGALREALALLDQRAAQLGDESTRRQYLEAIAEHAALRALAAQQGDSS